MYAIRSYYADGGLDIALSLTRVDDAAAWLSVPVRQAQYVLVISYNFV